MKKISPLNKKHILFLTLTVLFVLVLSGAASAGTPLQENQTGTVSGDLYVNTTDGWPSSTQGATNEVTQANTLPAYTSIDSAWVYVNVYSGSGSANWPVRTTIKLDGNGDGDYDDPGELLGIEDMNIPGSTDGTVYWLNDHCNRVYSDYQVWYDVTGLITCNNPTLYVKTENMGGIDYDGRIKLLALTVAYNDGDTDQVHYWVLNGQDWINTATSPSTSTFNTSTFNGQVTNATLNTVALSGTDGTYTLNGTTLTGNLTETGTYYKEHTWDVTSNINTGTNTTLTYANTGSSLKMNFATLAIREAAVNNGLADTPWPKYQGDNQNTGQSPYNGPQNNSVLWTYTTGGQITTSPVIAADGTIYIGSGDYKLYALNPDGTLKWKYNGGSNMIALVASDGTIYVSGGSGSYLTALNPDGTLKWQYPEGGGYPIYGSAAIADDGTIYFGSNDSKLHALNPDGTLKWTYTTGGTISSSPAIGTDGTIYIGSFDKLLYALNPDGTLKWTYNAGGMVRGPAIAEDGTIYVSGNADRKIYALNPDGSLKWSYTAGSNMYTSPAIADDGTLYFGCNDRKLYALNPDGTLKWTYTTLSQIRGPPTIGADGTIYFGNTSSTTDNVYALNPDGTLKWSYTTGSNISGPAAIGADGTLYIGSNNNILYAFNQPVADFTADVTPDYAPLTVHFTDLSERATSWAWDFDSNGTVDSTEQNPTYTYPISGTYSVTLTVYSALSSNSTTKTDYITAIAPPDDTEAPIVTVNPAGGTYTSAFQVTLTATDNYDTNPKIYYTTNGEDPTTASTQYTGPITINENTTLKFLGADRFGNIGTVQTETYTINDTEAPIVTVNPVSGTHNVNTTVTLSATDNADPNPLIYYTTNGEDPTTASTLYTGPITLPNFAVTTLKFIAADKNGNISPVQTETYNITDTEAPTVTATKEVNKVILTAADNSDPNPAIYYTTDGTDPTTSSTPYNGPFNIPGAAITVVKFIAVDVTGNTSPVQSQTFNTIRQTDILTGYYAEGNVGVKAVLYGGYGWFAYNEPGTGTAIFTPSSLNIPEGATILSARLYQSWTWRGYPEYTLQFNGTALTPTVHYVDGNDGQDFYDVTSYFNQNSDNTAVLTATGGCSYGTLLIVVYESSSEPYQKIWVNEGFDILYASSTFGSNPGPGHVYFNNVTTDNIASAQITAILPSGQGDGDTIIFNGQNFTTTSRNDSTDPAYAYFNVLTAIQNGANEIEYPAGGYYSIQNAILTLTMNPVADFTADVTGGFAPVTVQFTDHSTDATGWNWDFDNNGTTDSTDQNPIWTYNIGGTYTVKLTVTGPGGTDDEIKTDLITVDPSMIITNSRTNLVYTSIQDAIEDVLTLDGDNLIVHNGSYTENVFINKQLIFNTTGIVTVNPVNPDIPIISISSDGSGTSITGFNLTGAVNSAGVRLYSANNCILTDNTISGNFIGVNIYDSLGTTISGNTIQNNSWTGICLDQSTGNTINNNEISNNIEGVYIVNNSTGNTLTGNNIHHNTNNGIDILNNSAGNNISSNTLSHNAVIGLFIQNSNTNTITANTIQNNGWVGICLDKATGNTINSNEISNNIEGVYLVNNSHNNLISGNNIHHNTNNGIDILNNSTGNNIDSNISSNNGVMGLFIQNSSTNTVTTNMVQSNGWVGICLDHATENTMNNNEITGNIEGAYIVNGSTGNTLTGNNIHGNSDIGVAILNSDSNTIASSQVNSNGVIGIFARNSNSTVIHHNTINGNGWGGVILDTARYTTVYQNNFINNPLQAYAVNGEKNNFNKRTNGNHWNDWPSTEPRTIGGNEHLYDHFPSTTAV